MFFFAEDSGFLNGVFCHGHHFLEKNQEPPLPYLVLLVLGTKRTAEKLPLEAVQSSEYFKPSFSPEYPQALNLVRYFC